MGSYSYAGEKWLLFAREDNSGFVFTAVVTEEEKHVVAEVQVDQSALNEHSEELGLEIALDDFQTLFVQTLEQRQCMDLKVETNEEDSLTDVFLSLTYKFSPTISRKGVFHLPIVVADAPQSLVTLLASIHVRPPRPTLSEQQRRDKVAKEARPLATTSNAGMNAKKVVNIHETNGAGQSSADADATTVAANPMLLKRRRVSIGTMRRKGPRGAKLAKK